ncbi:hypothetical protein [Microbacterium sp. gxy059]|uniref:hypothetical protein n=1 Tax=Microbacterium sp. gxy059 TaxID=2957199 RepID=UPI003D96D2B3
MRATTATMLLDEMAAGSIDAVICRAPEFSGPGRTQSLTQSAVFDRIRRGRRPMVPLSATTRRSLIWTPDASRAMALIGNTPDAYGRTWHLPIDPHRPSSAEMIATASEVAGRRIPYTVVPRWTFRVAGLASPRIREAEELLPRYRQDNVFDSSAFAARFPDFPVTGFRDGIAQLLGEE